MVRIEKLSKEFMECNIEKICLIEHNAVTQSEGTYRNEWRKDNFLFDLPEKWTYSRVIRVDADIMGFYIASQKKTQDGVKCLHGHRVAFDKTVRNPSLLIQVYEDMFLEARKNSIIWFTGFQQCYHPTMLVWYQRIMKCYIPKTREEIQYFINRIPESTIIENDGKMLDYVSGEGYYLIVKRI